MLVDEPDEGESQGEEHDLEARDEGPAGRVCPCLARRMRGLSELREGHGELRGPEHRDDREAAEEESLHGRDARGLHRGPDAADRLEGFLYPARSAKDIMD